MIEISELIASAKHGEYGLAQSADGRYTLVTDYPKVSVYDNSRSPAEVMVAHSSMRADFETSVEEFVRDYFPEVQ